MDDPPLSRADRKELTKQRLIDAAQKLVATKGLAATSAEDVSAAAGYSRGAFYSNFRNKHDLFIELLRREHGKESEQFQALLRHDLPTEEIKVRMRDLYSTYCSGSDNFMSWTEARLLASRDAKFRSQLNRLLTEKREQIAQFIVFFYQRAGTRPPLPPLAMAMGFMSLIEGVKLFELSGPTDMTPHAAQTILALFMDSITSKLVRSERSTGGGVVDNDIGPTGHQPLVDSSIEVGRRRASGLNQRSVEIVVKQVRPQDIR